MKQKIIRFSSLESSCSVNEVRETLFDRIEKLITSHPSFGALKTIVDRADKRTLGLNYESHRERHPSTGERYICHTEYNPKSTVSAKVNKLAFEIIKDTQIPLVMPSSGFFSRGNRINWYQVAEDCKDPNWKYGGEE